MSRYSEPERYSSLESYPQLGVLFVRKFVRYYVVQIPSCLTLLFLSFLISQMTFKGTGQ